LKRGSQTVIRLLGKSEPVKKKRKLLFILVKKRQLQEGPDRKKSGRNEEADGGNVSSAQRDWGEMGKKREEILTMSSGGKKES